MSNTATYNTTNIQIFDNTTNLTKMCFSMLSLVKEKCRFVDSISDIVDEMRLDTINNDIVSHEKKIQELNEFLTEQNSTIQQINQMISDTTKDMSEIENDMSYVQNQIEQFQIGLGTK